MSQNVLPTHDSDFFSQFAVAWHRSPVTLYEQHGCSQSIRSSEPSRLGPLLLLLKHAFVHDNSSARLPDVREAWG